MQPTQGVSEQPQVVTSTRAARERRLPARFYDSIVIVSAGDRPVVGDKKSCRTTDVYLPVLDNLCSEFERRFDETQCSVMRGVQALNPTNEHFAELEQIRSFNRACKRKARFISEIFF